MRKILFGGICLLIFLEIVVPNIDWVNYKLFWLQIILATLLLTYGISRIFNQNYRQFKSVLDLPILVYLGWGFVSFFFSQFRSASSYAWFNVLVLVIFYFIFVSTLTKREELDYLVNLWIFSAVCLCIYALLFQEREITGSFGNPNLFASFLVSLLPFGLVRIYQVQDKQDRYFYLFSAFILLISLYLTKSRSGIGAGVLSVFLFFLLWFYLEKKRNKAWVKILLTGLGLSLVVLMCLIFYKKILFLDFRGRELIWQGTWKMIRERPILGWGIGSFVLNFGQFAPPEIFRIYPDEFVNNAHNEFLTLTSELGLIGLAIFFWLLTKIFLLAKKNFSSEDNYVKTMNMGAICSIIGVLMINLFDVSLRFVFTALFWWLAIGILVVSDKIEVQKEVREPALKGSPFLIKAIATVVSIILAANLIRYATHSLWVSKEYNRQVNLFRINLNQIELITEAALDEIRQGRANSSTYFKLGTLSAQKMDWPRAKDYLEKAIELDPEAIFAYTNLGNVYMNLGEVDQAMDLYRMATTIAPDYLTAHFNLGFAYFKKIQLKEALQEFDFILSKNKNDYQAWQMRQLIFE